MKIENHQHKTIHQRIEQLLRHRAGLAVVILLMVMGASSFDGRFRNLLQEVYAQGWGWMGTYLGRLPTTSGSQ
jgi:hypothetical protein